MLGSATATVVTENTEGKAPSQPHNSVLHSRITAATPPAPVPLGDLCVLCGSTGRGIALINRDVSDAGRGEWLALPAAPAVPQAQARELSHQVELGRPGVADLHG